MAEIILKDSKTNRDCIKIWEHIGNGVLLSVLKETVCGGEIDNFSSNLIYCIHKLSKLECIELHTSRSTDGKFSETVITQKNKPVIQVKLCSICQKIAPNKSHNAKYKDICHECTKRMKR